MLNYVKWEYETRHDEWALIHPDGCRDILLVSHVDQPSDLTLTDWDMTASWVNLRAGTKITGLRLRPGLTVCMDAFSVKHADESVLTAAIDSLGPEFSEITQTIDFLAGSQGSLDRAARHCGVSPRTLQRHFHRNALPKPDFWRLLGRARRAASTLISEMPLVDVAFEHGYSDQAHLTRELQRWFGASPKELKSRADDLTTISQPGLGNWP